MGGKFTVFLEIKKSEIKNQNRKKVNSHIIGNRKVEIQKRKAKKRQPVSKAKSENPKAKIQKRKAKIFSESPNQSISFARGKKSNQFGVFSFSFLFSENFMMIVRGEGR